MTVLGAGRTVLEVLQDFKSAQLPLEWLLQTGPHIKPRQFSIASSLAKHPASAHILVAVVDYRTPFKRRKLGLCSSWLASLQAHQSSQGDASRHSSGPWPPPAQTGIASHHETNAGSSQLCDGSVDSVASSDGDKAASRQNEAEEPCRVPVWTERGVLRMPASHSTPMVLVGPGTGVAPFRSFLEERQMATAGQTYVPEMHTLPAHCLGDAVHVSQ